MRYNTPVYFQKITKGDYDPDTGNYADKSIEETCVYADVTNAEKETLQLVYGELKQDSLVIRLQHRYTDAFNRVRVGDHQYRVDYERKLRRVIDDQEGGQVFVVSEVQ